MSTQLDERTDLEKQTSEPECAHIIKTEPGESAVAKVTEARIYGTSVEALCGHIFVPAKDATKLPMCQRCKDIYDMYRSFGGPEKETPDA